MYLVCQDCDWGFDGPHNAKRCRLCHSVFRREYEAEWVKRNKEHHATGNKRRSRIWREQNPELAMWVGARSRTKAQGTPFAIAVQDVVIPEVCPVLSIKLCPATGKLTLNSPTLDRIIPELGYVPGNVRVISWRANSLKKDATLEELRKLVAYMEAHL